MNLDLHTRLLLPDWKKFSEASGLTKEQIIDILSNGSALSWWGQQWSGDLFNFNVNKCSVEKGFDGTVSIFKYQESKIECKCLTKNVKFCRSINVGGKRTPAKLGELVEIFKSVDTFKVIVLYYPIVVIMQVKSPLLLDRLHKGELNSGGFTRPIFYKFMREEYDTSNPVVRAFATNSDGYIPLAITQESIQSLEWYQEMNLQGGFAVHEKPTRSEMCKKRRSANSTIACESNC